MKRYVYVPVGMVTNNGSLPEEAEKLARLSHLPIMTGTEDDGHPYDMIQIISIPSEKWMTCDQEVGVSYAHTISIADDSCNFDKNYCLQVNGPDGEIFIHESTLQEKHKLFFVSRYSAPGKYTYSVVNRDDNKVYADGEFSVI